jgi:hypothetical protein
MGGCGTRAPDRMREHAASDSPVASAISLSEKPSEIPLSSLMATRCRCEPSMAATIGRLASTTSMRAATIRTMRFGIRGPIWWPLFS